MGKVSKFVQLLNEGYRPVRSNNNEPPSLTCPHPGCGCNFSVREHVEPVASGVRLWSVHDVSNALKTRRADLGLSQPKVEDRALLPDRYLTKLESKMLTPIHGSVATQSVLGNAVLCILDREDVPKDAKAELNTLIEMANHAIALNASLDNRQSTERMPRLDTLIFLVNALGGELIINWESPEAHKDQAA